LQESKKARQNNPTTDLKEIIVGISGDIMVQTT
jgi:hypothetical protein